MTGTVLWGINNIYTVRIAGELYECRIKGKVLQGKSEAYNPLAPGDEVEFLPDTVNNGFGVIVARKDRRSFFSRWNKKGQAPQTLGANIDGCCCITSPESPPFRPRFIDRVVLMAGDVPVTVVCNKADLGVSVSVKERMEVFRSLGAEIVFLSAETGKGVRGLGKKLKGKRTLFVGQSGVGKSTLINRLLPGTMRKTAEISAKYNRGKHTTVYSVLLYNEELDKGGLEIIDTPGIREIEIYGIDPPSLAFYFPDLVPFLGKCRFSSCLHRSEPGCAVMEGVEEGLIHPDRYESYLRILFELDGY